MSANRKAQKTLKTDKNNKDSEATDGKDLPVVTSKANAIFPVALSLLEQIKMPISPGCFAAVSSAEDIQPLFNDF